jgi:predicted nuclease of predicted toxin-antitoxin system
VRPLFITLFLDEDVSVLIAKLVRSRAFSALTTQEAGQIGRSDSAQLEFATKKQMAILTHNRNDFEELARQYTVDGRHHCGILVAVRRSPYEITRRLLALMDRVTAEEMDDQLLYI